MYGVTTLQTDVETAWHCCACQSGGTDAGTDETDARTHVAETGHKVMLGRQYSYELRQSRRVSLPAGS